MFKRTSFNGTQQLYGVYYLEYALPTDDEIIHEYLWAGPYTDLQAAVKKAEELKITHQNDEFFVIRQYKDILNKKSKF